jgi:uncharacterized protein YjbI with pentapeptide repeats
MNTEIPKSDSPGAKTSSWPIDFFAVRTPPPWLSTVATTIVLLFALILFSLAIIAIARLAIDLLGDNQQRASEAVKSLLPIAAAAVGLPLIIWRLVILNQQTRISEAKTQIDRETHYTSIFSKSVEQLGQTRELKETRETSGGIETTTRTIPNIEVRLGGIHSLSRLSEESRRDTVKIENMLLSYVRENSWSDRQGQTTKLPPLDRLNTFSWAYYFRMDRVNEEAENGFAQWMKQTENQIDENQKWTKELVDTRVDVNEAIDALANVRTDPQLPTTRSFYECLFVGRLFKKEALDISSFERCTFVRCRLQIVDALNLRIMNSRLIGCSITCANSNLDFGTCVFIYSSIEDISNSSITAFSTEFWNSSFRGMKDFSLGLRLCNVRDGTISSEDSLYMEASRSIFARTDFSDQKFSSESKINRCALVEANLSDADMSSIELNRSPLNHTTATPLTRHPQNIPRPTAWPAFDSMYEDKGEIPF